MHADITRLDLRLRRRAMYGYAVGMAAYALVIVALYPSFRNETSLDELTGNGSTVAALFGVTGPLTTPDGWLDANLYANFVPLVNLLIAISYGAACLAGENENGTLGLLAALPIARRRIALQKAVTLVLLLLPVSVATLLCVLAGRAFDLTVGAVGVLGVTAGALLLGAAFGTITMLVGAVSGSRGTALGLASALAAASYLISSLAPVVSWLHPARYASLFFHAVGDGQLSHGLSAAHAGVLIAVTVLATLGCVAAFERLDVR